PCFVLVSCFVLCAWYFVLCKAQSTKNKVTAPLFVTTTPELSRNAARLRAHAARRASLPAGGGGRDRPQPHCSLLPRCSVAPVRARPETPSTPSDNPS